MREISDLLKTGVDLGDFPGASYAIVYKNNKIDYDYIGYRQLKPFKVVNDGQEIYDCASLTKVICTTTMVMKLIEEHKISLTTLISDILPKFRHNDITIYQLLTHSSGLPADIPNAKSLKNRDMVLTKIYDFDLINKPGNRIVYSDVGFILLGIIIEKITGKMLDVYADEIIFKPLNMIDSSYHPVKERCAPTEFRDDDVYRGLLIGQVHDEKAFALNGVAGHAGLFSTVKDISKFIMSILNNDGLVLKPETVDLLFPLQISDINQQGKELFRSLGWEKPTMGGTAGDEVSFENTILHTGFTGCNMWVEREKGIGFVMLSNAVHPLRTGNNILKYRNQIGNIILTSRRVNR
ncbi:MAG: serine hydrolase [Tenericutes bacterium]|nr:serine hydrolase [Mycoplasmatota bacterium]